MIKKTLFSLLALFAGPAIIIITLPFYNWTVIGGLCTAMFISVSAVISVWKKTQEDNG